MYDYPNKILSPHYSTEDGEHQPSQRHRWANARFVYLMYTYIVYILFFFFFTQ